MIYKLRHRFIMICYLSFMAVFLIVLVTLFTVSHVRTNHMADSLTEIISENNGHFPRREQRIGEEEKKKPPRQYSFINNETPAMTRYFSVQLDEEMRVISADVESISSISRTEAMTYAADAISLENETGWIDSYRYRITQTKSGTMAVFVDGSMMQNMTRSFLLSASGIFLGISLVVLMLIIIISRKAVKPMADGYEKQRQFITDASHELKTPLTLILTNVEIAEAELGQNEWLDDIRSVGQRMGVLIQQLVELSRMDEDNTVHETTCFSFGDAAAETAAFFEGEAKRKGLQLSCAIEPNMQCRGNEGEIRRLISILIDNAVKYCDEGGCIRILSYKKRKIHFIIENSCAQVETLDLQRLFDRFYRADPSRTGENGFGIGLSAAKEIARIHKGELSVRKLAPGMITFEFQMSC